MDVQWCAVKYPMHFLQNLNRLIHTCFSDTCFSITSTNLHILNTTHAYTLMVYAQEQYGVSTPVYVTFVTDKTTRAYACSEATFAYTKNFINQFCTIPFLMVVCNSGRACA